MKRAVITARGIVAPKVLCVDDLWARLKAGDSAIDFLTRFDAEQTGCLIGGQVPDFSHDFIPAQMKPKRMARHTVLLLKAAEQIRPFLPKCRSFGVRVGVATSDCSMISKSSLQRVAKGSLGIISGVPTQSPPHAAVAALSTILQPTGEVHTLSSACAAGLDAIGQAAQDVIEGRADCVLAGGADAPLEISPMSELVKGGLASLRNDCPEKASRPFDIFADTGVISEAAGLVLVEELEFARSRGSTILGEVIGYANRLDPNSAAPGSGYAECMRKALMSAGLEPWDIDYISAWGPGHPILDRAELDGIREVFGEWTLDLPISSIKGVIGNPFAGAGPAQVIAVLEGMKEQILPPTANLEVPIESESLRLIRNHYEEYLHDTVLINAHGIGGANTSLVLRRFN